MESAASQLQSLLVQAADLAETKLEILKLKAKGKVSSTISSLAGLFIIVLLASISGILFSIGAAILIGQAMGSAAYGFLVMGGFYLLCGLLIYLFRNAWIREPISRLFISKTVE